MQAHHEAERRAFEANVRKSYVYGFLMDFSLTAPIWVLYLRDERGLSLAQITLLEVPLFLLIVLMEVPSGAIADRFGRKVSLMLGSAILALALFVYGIATSYPLLLVSNVAWGLAFTFRSGADTALLYDSLKLAGRDGDFPRINGRLWALRSAAMLGGLLLGAPLAAATGYTVAISLSAIVAACAVPAAFLMHEPRRARAEGAQPYGHTLVCGIRDAWRTPALRYAFLFSGILGAATAGPLLLVLQPWLVEHDVGAANLGVWQALVSSAGVLSALTAGSLLARLGERGAFWVLFAALALCSMALAGISSAWAMVGFLGIAAVRGLHPPVLAGYVNRRIESPRRATVLSVQNLMGNVVMAVVWPLAGVVADGCGLPAVFLMYALGTLAVGGGALLVWDRAEHRTASSRRWFDASMSAGCSCSPSGRSR